MTLLLSGGASDPNLSALADRAQDRGIRLIDLRGAPGALPVVSFDPARRVLTHDGHPVRPVAAFLRPDVFTSGATAAHHAALSGIQTLLRAYLAVAPEVAVFNRDPFGRSLSVNKGAALAVAASVGLTIPGTRLGNDRNEIEARLTAGEPLIQKPVAGGDLCRPLDLSALNRTRVIPPVIAQTRIGGADLRVFRIGDRWLGFVLRSDKLDYRDDRRPQIEAVPVDAGLTARLRKLTDLMGLDWSASDFKLCPDRGPVYLETNANPMFAAFDKVSGGAVTGAMLDHLIPATRPEREAPLV